LATACTSGRGSRLDLTAEADVLHQEFASLFHKAGRQQARERLELCGWHGKA